MLSSHDRRLILAVSSLRRQQWCSDPLVNAKGLVRRSCARKTIATCADAGNSWRTSRCAPRRRLCSCAVHTPMPASPRSQFRALHGGPSSLRPNCHGSSRSGWSRRHLVPVPSVASARHRQGALCRRGNCGLRGPDARGRRRPRRRRRSGLRAAASGGGRAHRANRQPSLRA